MRLCTLLAAVGAAGSTLPRVSWAIRPAPNCLLQQLGFQADARSHSTGSRRPRGISAEPATGGPQSSVPATQAKATRSGQPKDDEPTTATAGVAVTAVAAGALAATITVTGSGDPATQEPERDMLSQLQEDLATLIATVREAQASKLDPVQVFQERKLLPDGPHYILALRALRLEGQHDAVLRLFANMDGLFAQGAFAYAELMASYEAMERFSLVFEVFARMKRQDIQPDLPCYNSMLLAFAVYQMWEKAVELLKEMRRNQITPNVTSYERAIAACNSKNSNMALNLLRSMETAGLWPSQECYRHVIWTFRKVSWKTALELVKEMQSRKIEVDEKSLKYVLSACSIGLDSEAASSIFRQLEADETLCLSELHYDICIAACERAGNWPEVISLAARMGARGISPHPITTNSVLHACVELGKWEVALSLLRSVRETGAELDGVAYSTVLHACAEAGKWEEVLQLHAELGDSQLGLVREETASPVIAALCEVDRMQDAVDLYREAVDRGWLRLWRRRRLGRGPAMLDTRKLPPQVAGVAVHVALSDAAQPNRVGTASSIGVSAQKEPQDIIVIVHDEALVGEVPEAVKGSTAAKVLQVAYEMLGKETKLQCMRAPFACVRIPGTSLQVFEVQRVQQAVKDFMLATKQGRGL